MTPRNTTFLVRRAPAILIAGLALAVAGCAGDTSDATVSPGAGPTSTADGSAVVSVEVSSSADEDGSGETEAPEAEEPGATVPPSATIVAHAVSPEVTVRVEPDDSAEVLTTLSQPTERGGDRVFEVLTSEVSPMPEWLEVRLPIRPNGTTGWIRSADVELSANPYRIEIDTSDYALVLFRADEVVLETPIAVGTGETPTPYGEFFITELLQPPTPDGPYGPFAFGLSGFSEVLTSFAGGEGVIGIHGTNDPSAIGTDVSSGCVRVENSVIEEMATIVPLGTPVEIRV